MDHQKEVALPVVEVTEANVANTSTVRHHLKVQLREEHTVYGKI